MSAAAPIYGLAYPLLQEESLEGVDFLPEGRYLNHRLCIDVDNLTT